MVSGSGTQHSFDQFLIHHSGVANSVELSSSEVILGRHTRNLILTQTAKVSRPTLAATLYSVELHYMSQQPFQQQLLAQVL